MNKLSGCIFIVGVLLSLGATEWKETHRVEDLVISEKEIPGSEIIAMRGDGTLDFPPRLVAWILLDRDHRKDWVPQVREVRLLRKINDRHFVEYTHVATPPMVRDREFISAIRVEYSVPEKGLVIQSEDSPTDPSPTSRYVRGRIESARFIISPGAVKGTTRLQSEIHADPRGALPKWIVNLFQRAWPVKTFRALREEAERRNGRPVPSEFLPLLKDLPEGERQVSDENKLMNPEVKNSPRNW